ncbi:hypothetical protein BDZ45DRAFT_752070 [Acephala macrosclerotiorum]|nr:hypothetical protein BDZ45DRAFT_752070 [Acephala macrosclerotiorum]
MRVWLGFIIGWLLWVLAKMPGWMILWLALMFSISVIVSVVNPSLEIVAIFAFLHRLWRSLPDFWRWVIGGCWHVHACRCYEAYIPPGKVETRELLRLTAENTRIIREYEAEINLRVAQETEVARLTELFEHDPTMTAEMAALRERARQAEEQLQTSRASIVRLFATIIRRHEFLRRVSAALTDCHCQEGIEIEDWENDEPVTLPCDEILTENERLLAEIERLEGELEDCVESREALEQNTNLPSTARASLRRMRQRLVEAVREVRHLKSKIASGFGLATTDETTALGMLERIRVEMVTMFELCGEEILKNAQEYGAVTDAVVQMFQGMTRVKLDLEKAVKDNLENQMKLGKERERALQLESIIRSLNSQARTGSLKLTNREPPRGYGAAEYISDLTLHMDGLLVQCQDSWLKIEGVGFPAGMGVSEYIHECSKTIWQLKEKVRQDSEFRNYSPTIAQ